jgi:hypothetical protein
MKNNFARLLLAVLAVGCFYLGTAAAQTANPTTGAGPGVVDPDHPRVNQVNQREENQQNRVANGISSGQLSSSQAAHLENRESRIQNQEQKDMTANNGHLTKQEQNQLNREQNRTSRRIYDDKHK